MGRLSELSGEISGLASPGVPEQQPTTRARPWQNPTPLVGFVPEWLGQFDTFEKWVDHAQRALTGYQGSMGEEVKAICIDAKGRRCNIGKDFSRARDENAFPIRYFVTGTVVAAAKGGA